MAAMIASLLSPTTPTQPAPQQGRISQLLPTVKCSSCNYPVPLTELGEHICASAPPVPTIPKSAALAAAVNNARQARAPAPLAPSSSTPARLASSPPRQESHQRMQSSSSTSRLRINTSNARPPPSPTKPAFQPKPSPLARGLDLDDDRRSTPSPRPTEQSPPNAASRTRMRAPSNAASINSNTPSTARPSVSFSGREDIITPIQTNPPSRASQSPYPSSPMRGPVGLPSSPAQGPGQGMPLPLRNGTPQQGPPPSNPVPFPRGPPAPGGFGNGPSPPGPPMGFPRSGPGPGPGPGGAPPVMGPRSMSMGAQSAPRPPILNNNFPPPGVPEEAFVPPAERGINTKTGGEAGMAGVGRRGFAAAARAAMFVGPGPDAHRGLPSSPVQYNRRPNAPQFLDLDAASRSTETPPLSAGSGYSSHSPGPTSPLPQAELAQPPIPPNQIQQRTPSPSGLISTPIPPPTAKPSIITDTSTNSPSSISASIANTLASPLSNVRLPFFEKFKNKLPGASENNNNSPTSGDINGTTNGNNDKAGIINNIITTSISSTPNSTSPSPSRTRSASISSRQNTKIAGRPRADTMNSSYSSGSRSIGSGSGRPPMPARSISSSSRGAGGPSASRLGTGMGGGLGRAPSNHRPAQSIDSESEYSGLAYADSTDYEDGGDDGDDFRELEMRRRNGSNATPLPPKPAPGAVGGSGARKMSSASNTSASSRIQFGSVSGRSGSRERAGIRIGASTIAGSVVSGSSDRNRHSRGGSVSSSYSDNEGPPPVPTKPPTSDRPQHSRARSNSSAIALALGLKETNPSDYDRIGGPGINSGRLGRSISGSSRTSSIRSRSQGPSGDRYYDRDDDIPSVPAVDREKYGGAGTGLRSISRDRGIDRRGARDMSRERSVERERIRERFADEDDESLAGAAFKGQRSKTVQGTQSPDVRAVRLPARSLTNLDAKRERSVDRVAGPRKAAPLPRKPKVCLRCDKTIEDGKWVQVDGGGVLCEKCWKNMYLPKCRRCNLPIEKAAVSSSDGQLKGKYHRECFNCHTCHKPFPDKTFYVYDGKPLCAYHYHEANDSLCAAARCGQPIEGPCAVSHTGDRYHPEHMTCEYSGYPECRQQLSEYWEVDGRMLCERHALNASRNGDEDDDRWAKTTRAMKRTTRFIDLAGGVGGGGGGGGGRGYGGGGSGGGGGYGGRDSYDDDSGLR